MAYSVVWKFRPSQGSAKKLISTVEAMEGVDSVEDAKKEGRQILAEVTPGMKGSLSVLAVAEVSDEMMQTIQGCPTVGIPMGTDGDEDDDVEFADITDTEIWLNQGWWHK